MPVIDSILEKFNNSSVPMSEHDITDVLGGLSEEDKARYEFSFKCEMVAFDLVEKNHREYRKSGEYYFPLMVTPREDGLCWEYPSPSSITPEMISYWKDRIDKYSHPILKSRYSGLVWEYSKKVCGTERDIAIGRIHIGNLILIADNTLNKSHLDIINKLYRALSLAVIMEKQDLVEKAVTSIMKFEKVVEEDDELGIIGFSYDFLIENKRINLGSTIEKQIVNNLERIFLKLSGEDEKCDPFMAEPIAIRLSDYYKKHGNMDQAREFIRQLGKCYKRYSGVPAARYNLLDKMRRLYHQYGMKVEENEMIKEIRAAGKDEPILMSPITTSIQIDKKQIDQYAEDILTGGIHGAFLSIALDFIPIKDYMEESLRDSIKASPLIHMINTQIVDSKGRVTANIGPIGEDDPGQLIRHTAMNIRFQSLFLKHSIDKLREQGLLTKEAVSSFMRQSPIFEADNESVVEKCIDYYISQDFIGFMHTAIPIIESTLRNIVELNGGNVLSPGRNNEYNLISMYETIHHPVFKEVFLDDVVLYFDTLLIDKRGYNLRNNVCHGITHESTFNEINSNLLFHVLLLI